MPLIPLSDLHPSDYNPRTEFAREYIAELAKSIAEHGILQPLLVRRCNPDYEAAMEIIGGECRYRAAKLAGLEAAPCTILEVDDGEAVQIALIENIKRRDLSPLDEARGFRLVMEKLGWTAKATIEHLDISKSHFFKRLSLLELPEDITERVRSGAIPVTHAQQLARIHDQPEQLNEIFGDLTAGKVKDCDALTAAVDQVIDEQQRLRAIQTVRQQLGDGEEGSPDLRFDPDPAEFIPGSDRAMPWRDDSPTWDNFLDVSLLPTCVDAVAQRGDSGKWEARGENYYLRDDAEALRDAENAGDTIAAPASTAEAAEDEGGEDPAAAATPLASAAADILALVSFDIDQAETDLASSTGAYLLHSLLLRFDPAATITEALLADRDVIIDPQLAAEEVHDSLEKWTFRATPGEIFAALIDLSLRDPHAPANYLPGQIDKAAILFGTRP